MTTLLEDMLAVAVADSKTADKGGGELLVPVLEGMSIRRVMPRRDERGRVTEIYDRRWSWHDGPIDYVYQTTIQPGFAKGWNLHMTHEDRYFVTSGDMALITFDPREHSSTFGMVSRVVLSASEPCVVNVPKFVWHADHNIGTTEVVIVSFPTLPYDHDNPDKYRLPLDTPFIPYDFHGAKGW